MAKESTPKIVSKKHLARLERERRQRRIIQIVAGVVIILVIGIIIYGVLDQTVLKAGKAVAMVGDQKITVGDFQKQVMYSRQQLIQQYGNYAQIYQMLGQDPNFGASFLNNMKQIESQLSETNTTTYAGSILDQLIGNILVEREAKARGITVTDQEVEDALQKGFNFFPNGTPIPTSTPTEQATSTLSPLQLTLIPPTATPMPSPTIGMTETPTMAPTATPTLDPATPSPTPTFTATPYTLAGYKDEVQKYIDSIKNTGYSEQDLRKLIYDQLLSIKLRDAMTADLKPEQEQVWARHILVSDEATAQEVLKKINSGEDWVKLAAQYSQDTSNKDKGGDLGWFARGAMVKEFEDAAFAMKVGEISQPVKSQFGYHIIQVLGHDMRPLTPTEFSSLRQQNFNDWLQKAETGPDIQKFDIWTTVVPVEPTLDPNLIQQ